MPGELGRDDISTLLRAWSEGDRSAVERLTPAVYEELRRLAHHYMKAERPGHSLQTTASQSSGTFLYFAPYFKARKPIKIRSALNWKSTLAWVPDTQGLTASRCSFLFDEQWAT
jgi:ECF sigma factor